MTNCMMLHDRMKLRVKVGFMYYDGRKCRPYERSFNKHTLEAFHSASHWKHGVRMLILIQGEKNE